MLLGWSECADYPSSSWNTVVVWTYNCLVAVRYPLWSHCSWPTLAFHIYLSTWTVSWACHLVTYHHFISGGIFPEKGKKEPWAKYQETHFFPQPVHLAVVLGIWECCFPRVSYLLILQTLIIIICSPCASILWHGMLHSGGSHSNIGERQPGSLRWLISGSGRVYFMMIVCTTWKRLKRTKFKAMVQNLVALHNFSNLHK